MRDIFALRAEAQRLNLRNRVVAVEGVSPLRSAAYCPDSTVGMIRPIQERRCAACHEVRPFHGRGCYLDGWGRQ